MRAILFTLLTLWGVAGNAYRTEGLSPERALERLMKGNQRYVNDALEHPNRSQERREASSATQAPYAIILGCSDSRVSPEIIFDEGVGDLFIIRVAGNVIGPLELDSIEYAALYLGSVLVVVMGHENCGAVQAVVSGNTKDIEAIAQLIAPAVKEVKQRQAPDLVQAAVKANALHMKEILVQSKVIDKLMKDKKLDVKAAYYRLESGVVELL